MTREEVLQILDTIPTIGEQVDALEVAIQALEQEPCEDAISRQALLEEIENGIKAGNYEEGYEKYSHINDMDDIIECIKYADSIQPKPKTGHWIETVGGTGALGIIYTNKKCSECGWEHELIIPKNFCPNCGAKMVEPQESEVRE